MTDRKTERLGVGTRIELAIYREMRAQLVGGAVADASAESLTCAILETCEQASKAAQEAGKPAEGVVIRTVVLDWLAALGVDRSIVTGNMAERVGGLVAVIDDVIAAAKQERAAAVKALDGATRH